MINNKINKVLGFQNFLLSFPDISFEVNYPSQSFQSTIETISKIKKKKPFNVNIGINIADMSQPLPAICKTPNIISSIKIDGSVKSIPEKLFAGHSTITSISIPFSVKEIGDNAFDGCSSLTEVEIPTIIG